LVRSSPEDQDQLTGRVGLATNWQNSWTSASGDVKRQHSYMIANLHYEFFDTTTINAFGTDLDNQRSRFNGEIGIGGTYNWGNDRFSLYGETSVSFNLVDFAESYSLQGQLGLRIAF
jgi:fibronectin-binding autotransporter adhesin